MIPFVAGVLDASKRTGDEREIEPPSECPSCGQPLTEQGNSRELYCTNVACPAQTVRRLIHWASRAAADIDAIGAGVDRAPQRGRAARARVGLLRARPRAAARASSGIGEISADRMIESIDRSRARRPAPRADRPGDPDGLRGHGGAAVPGGLHAASRRSPTPARRRSSRSRTSARRSPRASTAHLNRDEMREEIARLRERGVEPRRARRGPAAGGRRATRRWPARPSSSPARSPTRAAARRSRGPRSSGCASAPARPPRHRCRRTPTC